MPNDTRYHQEWETLSRYIRKLFNHHCAKCGQDCNIPNGSKHEVLQVHHIDENPGNNAIENLIPLCSRCHLQIEKEARLHAPHHGVQQELFENHTYRKRMEEMRRRALVLHGVRKKAGIQQMSEEEYDTYTRNWEWENGF